jgi:hypothetical protein
MTSVQAVSLYKLEITVDIGEDKTSFTEKYFLVIPVEERQDFLRDVEGFGRSLMQWRNNYPFIFPHFGTTEEINEISFYYDAETHLLELSYEINENIASIEVDAPRTIKWSIPENFFENFITGTTIEIPANVQLIFNLPKNATVVSEELSREINLQDHQIMIQDYRGSNLLIYYYTDKPIAPPLDVDALIAEFFTNPLNQTAIALLAFLLLAMIIYRRKLTERVENFIVKNSQLAEKESIEEEVELE